jgi:hypothetical protein
MAVDLLSKPAEKLGMPRTKLIHLAWEKLGCPPPTKALCGARIKWEATDATGPDCVVCASLLAGMESGVGG